MNAFNALDEQSLKIIAKVEKLLALANHPGTGEGEATAAAAAAQKLLEAYNLDVSMVEQHSGSTGKREDTTLSGGLYKWQRRLWMHVAELNFCLYRYTEGNRAGHKYQHRIIGRTVNVATTRIMAEYIQGAIERLARERVNNDSSQFFTKSSASFREGMADRIVERLDERRYEQLEEDRRKKAAEKAKQSHPGYASPKNALVLTDVIDAENDANMDMIYGAGWSARQKARRAEANASYEKAMVDRQKWRDEHPEEAAARDAEEKRRQEEYAKREERNAKRRKGRTYYAPSYKGDYAAYREGHRKGNDVGLDQQIDRNRTKGLS